MRSDGTAAAPLRRGRLRQGALRRTLRYASALAAAMLLLAGFIYWQTVRYLTWQIDDQLLAEVRTLTDGPEADIPARLNRVLAAGPAGTRAGGLFDEGGRALAGNMPAKPARLPASGHVGFVPDHGAPVDPGDGVVRLAVEALPDGGLVAYGRRADELGEMQEIVGRALLAAGLPIALLALVGGAVIGRTTVRRVEAVEQACRRIIEGQLDQRLPVGSDADAFDVLAATVNEMLEEIERLMHEVKTAGDAIAHDLRTPLTRLRARLDRLLARDVEPRILQDGVERTIADVDQLLAMTRAILRIGEIENGRRRAGFGPVDLAAIVREVGDFYAAIAEEKRVAFTVVAEPVLVHGDGELLFEAVGNLVDNAVKFTPAGGRVSLALTFRGGARVEIADGGPGIAPAERSAVLKRFYRAEPSRTTPGSGLGLAVVAAIARLHGFRLDLNTGEGGKGCTAVLTAGALVVGRDPGPRPASLSQDT